MILNERSNGVYLSILAIFSISFFGANFLNHELILYCQYILYISVILFSVPYLFKKEGGFVLPIQLIIISTISSIFFAYYTWDQGILLSIKATAPYLIWFFFFYLLQVKIPIKTIENTVITFGIIFIALFLYQYIWGQSKFFGFEEIFLEERGTIRVRVAGSGFFILTTFIALNKLTKSNNKKIFWLLLTISGIIIPYLQATRQAIIAVALIYIFHFTRKAEIQKRVLIFVIITLIIYYFISLNLNIVNELISAQQQTNENWENYIRVVAGSYFLLDFTPNTISKIFGNGVPFGDKSIYGKTIISFQDHLHFYLSDVGLISFYVLFGIIAVIGYILIWIKSIKYKVPSNLQYLRYYLWFLLITCLTSDNMYSSNFIMANILTLYCYHISFEPPIKINKKI